MPAPGTAKAVNGPLKLYLLPKPKTHPHLVISFKEPAGQGHLFLVFAPSSCTTKHIKPLLEIFLAPANQFLLIKQSKGQEGIKSETEKYFNWIKLKIQLTRIYKMQLMCGLEGKV